MIDNEIETALHKVLFSKAKELEIEILAVNGTEDHIHILIESHPSIAPADIVKHLKDSSSHFVNHVTLKNDKTRVLYWQDGYGIISVSPKAVKTVCQYIANQKEHHKAKDLKEELEISSL